MQLKIKVKIFNKKTHDIQHAYPALLMLGFKEVVRVACPFRASQHASISQRWPLRLLDKINHLQSIPVLLIHLFFGYAKRASPQQACVVVLAPESQEHVHESISNVIFGVPCPCI